MPEGYSGRQKPRTRAVSEDRRAVRARTALVDALTVLIAHTPMDAISVHDVTRLARTNRTTFYSHFRNTEDLALTAVEAELEVIADVGDSYQSAGMSPEEASRVSLLGLFEYTGARRQTLKPLLGRGGSRRARLALFYALIEHSAPTVRRRLPAHEVAVASYAVGGAVYGVLIAWIEGLVDGDAHTCVELFFQHAPAWLRDTR